MNGWLAAAAVLLAGGLAPAVWGAATGPVHRRIIAQNLATLCCCLTMLLLAQGYARTAYQDLALLLSVLGPAGTLVYARLLADDLAADPPGARATRAVNAVTAGAVTLVVVPLCVVAPPGRGLVKLLVIGVLLAAGTSISTRALSRGPTGGTVRG